MDARIAQVRAWIKDKDYKSLLNFALEEKAVNLGVFLHQLEVTDFLILFRLLPKDRASQVYSYLSLDSREKLMDALGEAELESVLERLNFDDLIDALEEMPANFVQNFLASKSRANRELINEFLCYPPDSAGSLMTIEFLELKEEWIAQKALEYIRLVGDSKETIYTCYLTDKEKHLIGLVSLRTLILCEPTQPLRDLAYQEEDIVSVCVLDKVDKAILLCHKYALTALPVVDTEKRLVGIITIDDVMDRLQEGVTESFERMAAINPLDETYFQTSIWQMFVKRLPWLLILLVSASFSSGIIGSYEAMLASVTVLANYIPLLMNTAGNAGAQSTALIIRGLALDTVKIRDFGRVLFKEVTLAFLIGAVMAFINFMRLYCFDACLIGHECRLQISFFVSLALLCGIVLAKFLGGCLPIVLKALGLDPAFMAGSVISTLLDILMITTYFKIMSLFLVI